MNSKFKDLLSRYDDDWSVVTESETLEEIREAYIVSEETREECLTWIFENVSEGEEQANYFSFMGDFEAKMVEDGGDIPVFDEDFDIFQSFDEYESYYQRYGCLTPEFILSWDTENVLFDDGDGNVEIVKRPDVLMGGAD